MGELAHETVGTGKQRVVFLHGLMGRRKNFSTIARRLGSGFTSLLVDLPNHGASCWTERFDYAETADLLANFLSSGFASHGAVDVVGHSMGGKVAMMLALRHPELVRRLVVLDIAPSSSEGNFDHLLGAMLALPLAEITTRGQAAEALQLAIPSDSTRGFLLQNLKRQGGQFVWEPNLQMLFENLDRVMGWEQPMLQFLGPVLWVAGELSGYVGPEDSAPMRELFPRVRKVKLRDAGHWVHADKPAEVVEILQTFLSGQ